MATVIIQHGFADRNMFVKNTPLVKISNEKNQQLDEL